MPALADKDRPKLEAEVAVAEVEVALRLEMSRICCLSSLRFERMSMGVAKMGGECELMCVGLERSLKLRPELAASEFLR